MALRRGRTYHISSILTKQLLAQNLGLLRDGRANAKAPTMTQYALVKSAFAIQLKGVATAH